MGMFDSVRCLYPLPLAGANDRTYQTKDTPAQFCDNYEIREDGTLWHQAYDLVEEDWSPKNRRWEPVEDFTGEVRFYDFQRAWNDGDGCDGWIEWSAYFENGKIARLNLIENR